MSIITADQTRIATAAEKRLRKLARYTQTPAALARRALTEALFDRGTPIAPPREIYPEEYEQ